LKFIKVIQKKHQHKAKVPNYYLPTIYPSLGDTELAHCNSFHMQKRRTLHTRLLQILSDAKAWNPTKSPEQLNNKLRQISKDLK